MMGLLVDVGSQRPIYEGFVADPNVPEVITHTEKAWRIGLFKRKILGASS